MIDCDLDNDAITCPRCGRPATNRHLKRNCKGPPCARLGGELRQIECPGCRGRSRLKVYFCAVHQACTLGKRLEGIACCAGCGDYLPRG